MASYRSHSATTYASRTNTPITAPAGIQDGDVLLLAFLIGKDVDTGAVPTPTLPVGFTIIGVPAQVADGTNFTLVRRLAWKVASSEPVSYDITHAVASSQALMVAVQGADAVTPTATNNSGTGSTTTALGLLTPTDSSYVAFIVHNWNLYGAALPPTGTTPTFTERLDSATSIMYFADGVLATAGATGDKTHGNTNPQAQYPWAAFLITVGNAEAPPPSGGTRRALASAGRYGLGYAGYY